jgi:hypothetical protein
VVVESPADRIDYLHRRLTEGLEQGLTLVIAKAVLGLLEAGMAPAEVLRAGVDFGTTYRREGWGAGLTVLVAMANLLPYLDAADQPLALVHGLAFVSRDTRGHAPRFPLTSLTAGGLDDHRLAPERLEAWYRRFIETRSDEAAERTLMTAIAAGDQRQVARMMFAAATDHVFLDEGHTIDFTNKAYETLEHLGWDVAEHVLPTLVAQTAQADRSEERGRWRHPHDLAALVEQANERLPALVAEGAAQYGAFSDRDVSDLGWRILGDDPAEVVEAVYGAIADGATPEQLGRAVALAAALRLTRFHTQNDVGDWDVVHHGFTAANALHQTLARHPAPALLRGVVHNALKVYLDRFLNIPAARLPRTDAHRPALASAQPDLAELSACWDTQGNVDRAGGLVYNYLHDGGDPRPLVAALGHALLSEDAGFHWYQTIEAAVRQFRAWPEGSDEGALILAGAARFLAAHTPTRRELPQVVRIAVRLRRGDDLFEQDEGGRT